MATGLILAAFHANDDFNLLSQSVAEFAERELVPYLRQLGREEFPALFIPLAANNGFVGSVIPAQYGGQSGTLEGLLSIVEGIAACDGSLRLTLAAHESSATTHILLSANESRSGNTCRFNRRQKNRAWCLTEPQAGSNIFNDTRTRLIRTSEGWKLTGEKTFITNGCHADYFVVLAQANGVHGRDQGMTACVVERNGNERGITATPLHNKMGMCRSDTATIRFDSVPVPDGAVLGATGSGGKVARRVLLRGRIGIAALALGLARDSFERAVVYAQARLVAGGLLIDQPITRVKLSRMEESLWAAWQGLRAAAQLADASQPFKVQACMAKIFATETALRIIDEAIQILGGYGYFTDYKVEQNYRDARLLTIGEGATEILRFAISGRLLSASFDYPSVLPNLDSLAREAALHRSSMSDLWDRSWRALQLAADNVDLVREQIEHDDQRSDDASAGQCRAAGFADLATRLWVAFQVVRMGTRLVTGGNATPKQESLVRSFIIDSAVEICHQASELLRTLGLTDQAAGQLY